MQLTLHRYQPNGAWTPALDPVMDGANTLILLFSNLDPDLLDRPLGLLRSAFPTARLSGCSTAGEILDNDLLDGAVAAVIRFEHTRLQAASAPIATAQDSRAAGEALARALDAPDLRAVFVLAEGLQINGSQLIEGFNGVLGNRVVITGGLAADGDRFERTWIVVDGRPRDRQASAVALYGDALSVTHGSRGGWDMLGPERLVTRAADNVLFELDGQPALEIYKRYLGERAAGLPSTGLLFPLALREDEHGEETRVRTILSVNDDDQSITFAGNIPQGGKVRLMHANYDRLIDGAAQAAEGVDLAAYHSGPLLSIAISCVGRRLVLGQRTEEEIEAVLEALPPGTRQVGYYSLGELSPLASGCCDLHNQTMTLTLLWEN